MYVDAGGSIEDPLRGLIKKQSAGRAAAGDQSARRANATSGHNVSVTYKLNTLGSRTEEDGNSTSCCGQQSAEEADSRHRDAYSEMEEEEDVAPKNSTSSGPGC